MDNRLMLTPGKMKASSTDLKELNVEGIYCDNDNSGNMQHADRGNLHV